MDDRTLNKRWIKDTIREAGEIAKNYFGKVKPSVKDNNTYVTQGDLEVQAFLIDKIQTMYPGDGIIAEESDMTSPPSTGTRTWVIDPIDGTSSFVRGFSLWGIAVGLLEELEPIAGFFYMPVTGDFFSTGGQGQVLKNELVMHPRQFPERLDESVLLVDSKFHKMFTVTPDYKGKIRSLGSASAHMSYLATGSADAVLLPDLPIWDLATGFALLKNTDCIFRYFDGTAISMHDILLDKKAPKPILCGFPDMIRRVQEGCTLK